VAEFFNSLGEREMLLSLATFLGLSAILTLLIIGLIRLAVNRLKRFAALTATKLDDILLLFLENTLTLVIIVSAFFFVAGLVRPHQLITRYLELSFGLLIIVQIAYWANILINFFTDTYSAAKRAENIGAITTISALGFIAKLLLFFALLFVALDNFGVKVTTLIAGLGVGGIAIALAVQNILGDMFASLSIILDKPFVVGDFIVVDTYLGTVEHVGLKTTRIRSLSGEQLVFRTMICSTAGFAISKKWKSGGLSSRCRYRMTQVRNCYWKSRFLSARQLRRSPERASIAPIFRLLLPAAWPSRLFIG
jgi:small-conductance mechanosensitive channel